MQETADEAEQPLIVVRTVIGFAMSGGRDGIQLFFTGAGIIVFKHHVIRHEIVFLTMDKHHGYAALLQLFDSTGLPDRITAAHFDQCRQADQNWLSCDAKRLTHLLFGNRRNTGIATVFNRSDNVIVQIFFPTRHHHCGSAHRQTEQNNFAFRMLLGNPIGP